VTDAPGHLGLDALADVLAGGRDDAHLRSCLPCTDRLAELAAADASVTAALGALPPPPLPDGLSERLAQALRDERRREQDVVRPLRRRRAAWLPTAAASAALVLAGAVGYALLDPSGTASQEVSTSAAGGAQDEGSSLPESAAGLAVPRLGTGTDWADEAVRPAAVSRLLDPADPFAGSSSAVPSGDRLDRLRDPAALAACLANLPGGGAEVLAVDYAQYAGAPAVAVVQPDAADRVRLTVVGSGCSAADPELLTSTTLPRR
jgi:hypothetical protein